MGVLLIPSQGTHSKTASVQEVQISPAMMQQAQTAFQEHDQDEPGDGESYGNGYGDNYGDTFEEPEVLDFNDLDLNKHTYDSYSGVINPTAEKPSNSSNTKTQAL